MTLQQWEDVIDGCALIERLGEPYEYVGTEKGKFVFQSVNDDSSFQASFEDALKLDVAILDE